LGPGEPARWQRRRDLDEILVDGCYPRLHDARIPVHQFHADYLGPYLERDLRQILRVSDLGQFQRFLGFFAGRHAQIMNYGQLASDVGIDQTTAKAWCDVLEASHVAMPLRPWFANIGKRLAKSPKWYLIDSGLAAHLVGVTSSRHLATSVHRGRLFEGLIVAEGMKIIAHHGSPAGCLTGDSGRVAGVARCTAFDGRRRHARSTAGREFRPRRYLTTGPHRGPGRTGQAISLGSQRGV